MNIYKDVRKNVKHVGFTQHHFSMFFVYIIQSLASHQIYIGSTNQLQRRLEEHNAGKNFSTKSSLPWKYIYYEAYANERAARLREKRLKYNGNAVREVKQRIGLLPRKSVEKSGAGFTLIELIITASIFAIVGTGIGVLAVLGFRSWDQNRAQVDAQENAREALARVTKIVREAQPSNNGSYPILTAEAQTLTIYADIDGDGNREQVRYFLTGTQLKQGTIKPVGTPATYPAGNESVTIISNFIRNGADPIFTYFDENFTGTQAALAQPVNLLNVRLVHINLKVDADTSKPPAVIILETSISFRNLKNNL